MYSLVLYSLSPIQKGIQAYHSTIEYSMTHGKSKEYKQWAEKDKTVIILNGGNSNQTGYAHYSNEAYFGTIDLALNALKENKIKFAVFREPDINNTITSVSFLVDEKVWDKKNFPDLIVKGFKINEDEQKLIISQFGYTKEQIFLKEFLQGYSLAN